MSFFFGLFTFRPIFHKFLSVLEIVDILNRQRPSANCSLSRRPVAGAGEVKDVVDGGGSASA
jgi:hypothetical protein